MNFDDVWTRQQAQDLALPLPLVTKEDEHRQCQRDRRLAVAELDERAMAEWRDHFPEDVADDRAFWEQRRAEHVARQAAKRARQAAALADLAADNANPDAPDWASDDPRLNDIWTTSDVTTSGDNVGFSD
ncbi:unnamed protein product [Alopecurus aequalis]